MVQLNKEKWIRNRISRIAYVREQNHSLSLFNHLNIPYTPKQFSLDSFLSASFICLALRFHSFHDFIFISRFSVFYYFCVAIMCCISWTSVKMFVGNENKFNARKIEVKINMKMVVLNERRNIKNWITALTQKNLLPIEEVQTFFVKSCLDDCLITLFRASKIT